MKVNTVVIGAGPGGYVAAIRLAQLGIETLVIEKQYMGGVCLNVGCIPSKAVIHAAKSFYKATNEFASMGISGTDKAKLEFPKMIEWKDGIVSKLTGGIRQLLKGNKVKILDGAASFKSKNQLEVKLADGKTEIVDFKNCIIATGSTPTVIPALPVDQKDVLDSTGALALQKQPKSISIIGGGYIGLELGMAFAKLGTEVTIVEFMDSVLASFDADVIKLIERKLKKLKVKVLTKSKAQGVKKVKGGVELTVETPKGEEKLVTDKVCVCVGRTPFTADLKIENAGLKTIKGGFLEVNSRLQTKVKGIYAIGDLAGQPMLAHKASKEGEIAAEVIAGHNVEMDVRQIPAVVFSDPEIAQSGISEKEAVEKKLDVKVSKFPYAAIGRALTTNETEGFVKFISDAKTNEVLGITIVGASASDLISEAALAIEMCAFTDDIGLTVHPHPTFGEILMEAAKGNLGEAIHIINK